MPSSRFLVALLTVVISVTACSEDPAGRPPQQPSDGGTPDSGTLDPIGSEYCDVYRMACRRQVECGVAVVNQEATEAACKLTAACDAMLDDLTKSGQLVRTADVRTCIDALRDASCTALANNRLGVSAACGTIHGGNKQKGEACGGGVLNDCELGLVCDAANTCPGVCKEPEARCIEGSCPAGEFCSAFGKCEPQAALGETCDHVPFGAVTENSCVAGAFCNREMKCVASIALGQSCDSYDFGVCEEGAACIDGTCETAREINEQCSTASECEMGLFCDFRTGTCAPRAAQGESCTNALGACGPGLECDLSGGQTTGTCKPEGSVMPPPLDTRPIADAGGDCSDAICPLGSVCKCVDSNCTIQRCQAGAKLGETCTGTNFFDPYSCAEGMCDFMGSGKCVRPQPIGSECNSFNPITYACVSGFCALGKCASASMTECQ